MPRAAAGAARRPNALGPEPGRCELPRASCPRVCASACSTAALVLAAEPHFFSAMAAVPPRACERIRAPIMFSSHVGFGTAGGSLLSANEEPLPPLDTAEPLAERGRDPDALKACCPSARSTAALVAAAGPQAFSASSAVPPSTGERTRAPMMLSSHVGGGGSAGARPPWSHHMDAAAKDFVRPRILEVQRLFLTRDVSLCLAHAARAYRPGSGTILHLHRARYTEFYRTRNQYLGGLVTRYFTPRSIATAVDTKHGD